jgi:hypothetical protein
MNQRQIANWAKRCLEGSWLYQVTSTGELVLPVDVRHDWCFINANEELTPRLLYTTTKKVVYRVKYLSGSVDVAVPLEGTEVVQWPRQF